MGRSKSPTRLGLAAEELEKIRKIPKTEGIEFPPACRSLLYSLPGARRCIDCDAFNPRWASISYGTLLCLKCSGRHRSYGVQTSFVRSIDMDTWSHTQVLSMLEGGNEQLKRFFERHEMGNDSKMAPVRYKTKAALFYRANLQKHVESVAAAGVYRGREAVRRTHLAKQKMLVTTGSCCTPKASSSTNGTTSVSGKSKKQIIAAA